VGGTLVVFAPGVICVGRCVDVKNGTDVGVTVKVAVSCGVGLAEFRTGSVGEIVGLEVVLSAVGVV